MRYHYISDSHVHSDCSFDGTDPVMMICERAAALGLYSIAVTDHCECDIYYKEGFDRSVVQSFFETRKARAVFYGRLQVYAGIELGQPITDPKATREALSAGAFDFVLASVHNLPGQKDFYYLNYTDENVDPLLSDYFEVTTDYLLKGIEPAPPVRDKRADGRIFTIVASVLNLIGVLVACVVFYETQMAGAIVIGLVFLALGCMVFGIGMVESAPDSKPRAKRDFWLVNIWLLAFMPWSFVWNVIYTFPGAPYPLGGCLGVFWVVYLLGCTAVALLQIKKARAEKGGG